MLHILSHTRFYHTGEAIIAYATPTESNAEEEDELVKELRLLVRSEIGPFAAPDVICITPSLPMVSFIDKILTMYIIMYLIL
jgi:acyl-coenzyme A synthetase/AMP-(fatty) acid ligase